MGWSVVNMTGMLEAAPARELEMCYIPLALVTDVDVGIDAHGSIHQADVLQVFGENIDRLRKLVGRTVQELPAVRDCACGYALGRLETEFAYTTLNSSEEERFYQDL